MSSAAQITSIEYPVWSMAVCLLLIYLSPFVSLALNYIAFAICLYRVVRYDESVFAIDYCILAGSSYIFLSTGRVSLLAWLSIIFALWHIIKNGAQCNTPFVLLIILLDYMLIRTGTAINNFVLCFSPLLLLYVLLSTQKETGIVPNALAFCGNVILSSTYALVFRDSSQIRSLLGNEVVAYWGSSQTRFQGLFRDPNYYMTMLLISIALIVVLFMNQYISRKVFVGSISVLVFFGALTYSKTFLIVLAIFVLFLIIRLFLSGHFFIGIGSILLTTLAAIVLSDTLFSVVLYRIFSSDNLYDLTTGRSELLIEYLTEITKSASTFFFGVGLSADILERGTHNLFLEIVYYLGFIGLLLIVVYFISLLRLLSRKFEYKGANPNGLFRYVVLIVFLLLFCTLQGMTFVITYVMLYLAILATEMSPNTKLSRQEKSFED